MADKFNPNQVFGSGNYDQWRRKRIDKIISLYGKEFFKGKRILELGCGTGHTGNIFELLGAIVTFAEGRQEYLEHIHPVNEKSTKLQLDQDKPWSFDEKFDVIIHWGVLYHLENWEQDLKCAVDHSDLIFLETWVSFNPGTDVKNNIKVSENMNQIDQALHGVGSRPSTELIEAELTKLGTTFKRYDDPNISTHPHYYHWTYENPIIHVNDDGTTEDGLRRFWVVEK